MAEHVQNTTPLAGKVAIVTGAGAGLGRSHALELARLGARVVVNDLSEQRNEVADEIRRSGGEALAYRCDVTDMAAVQAMVDAAMDAYGRVDILVNNAGILRDRTFAKMPLEDFRLVMEVHVMGAVHTTKAVWPLMQEQKSGRIVLTTSSSGLYGNFGQSNYSAAKMALVGLMKTLSEEGRKYDIRVNCLAPTAVTAMTAGLLPEEAVDVLTPERVSVGLLALAHDDAPSGTILLAGGGSFEAAHITMTQGVYVPDGEGAAQQVHDNMAAIVDPEGQLIPATGWDQSRHELAKAKEAAGV